MTGGAATSYRFSVDDYYRMADAGILHEDSRVELIDGEVVQMSPIGSRHAGCVMALTEAFGERLARRAVLSVQSPVRLSRYSEPEPDIALLRPRDDRYRESHPTSIDTLLIIEVADSSLAYDRGLKLSLYAEAGIPEVWIADLEAEQIEVYRAPSDGKYGESLIYRRGSSAAPIALPEITLTVDEIFG